MLEGNCYIVEELMNC